MHSFEVGRSLRKQLAGTTVDEIMRIERWNTELVARYDVGVITGASAATSQRKRDGGSKRERDHGYATAIDLPLSPAFQKIVPRANHGRFEVRSIFCVRFRPIPVVDEEYVQGHNEVWAGPLAGAGGLI